ncbi:MAG TPA: Shedu anti-phage system protein SduA domain-containing protein [Polyangia bacterium]|jgi:hypothetical protein
MISPIFVGLADKVLPPNGGNPTVPTDIRGLRQIVTSWLYPLDLRNFVLVLLLPEGSPLRGRIELVSDEPLQEFFLDYELGIEGRNDLPFRSLLGFPLRGEGIPPTIWQPAKITIYHAYDGIRVALGVLEFLFVEPPPLAIDQKRAIESNPAFKRMVRIAIACSKCRDGITPYAGLEKTSMAATSDAPNPVWYRDLEGTFKCSCGQLTFPVKYLREGLPHLLWAQDALLQDGSFAVSSQISLADAEKILGGFEKLLRREPLEEDVQKYIEQNPLLLAPFAARHVFFKPPILNKWRADFGVVNSQNELILIEIERPNLPLFTKDGVQHSKLTQAFSQAQVWDHEISRHRAAVLSGIQGCPPDVARVRYLVIAGRSSEENDNAVARTVNSSRGHDFMTYDQLIESVRNAVRSVTG